MDRFSHAELRVLLEPRTGPYLSIYLPMHRVKEDAAQDPIRLRNLLRQAEGMLSGRGLSAQGVQDLLAPALALPEHRPFWQRGTDGLALFLRPGFMQSFRLPIRFDEMAVVAPRFHVSPLFAMLSADGEYGVLAVSQKAVRLYHCTRFEAREVPLTNVPAGMAEVLQNADYQKQLQMRASAGAGGRGLYHGHGDASEIKRDALIDYFRQIDRGVREAMPTDRMPLVLAAVDYLVPLYREVSSYPGLLPDGVPGNPDEVRPEELQQRAWDLVAPQFMKGQRRAVAEFEAQAGTGRATNDLEVVLRAGAHGRVESLFIPVGRNLWGHWDPAGGEAHRTDVDAPQAEDLLNLAAIVTYQQKGTVYTVEPHQVPGHGTVAAVLRY